MSRIKGSKNRRSIKSEANGVYVKVYPDQMVVDISYPDRSRVGYYLHHIKNIPVGDAKSLLNCLTRVFEE